MHRPMVLVPIEVEHRVDAVGSQCADMLFDAGDQIVQGLVQAGIWKVVLANRADAQRLESDASLGCTVELGRPTVVAIGEYNGMNGDAARRELCKRGTAAELEIVGMRAQG